MNALTLDQFSVFAIVVEEGSFAAAARRMGRAQSAVTYAVQKMEEQSGLVLFDRSSYRAALTESGRSLFPRVKRILEDVADYKLQVLEMTRGLEAELRIVLDAYTPADLLSRSLEAFNRQFPRVELNITVEPFEAASRTVRDGRADIGVLIELMRLNDDFERCVCGTIDLVAVAAPTHPLAEFDKSLSADALRDHTQLILTSDSDAQDRLEYGVHATNGWRLRDIDTKHRLLLAGVGWGSMPRSKVADDLTAGTLVELKVDRWEGADKMPEFPLVVAHSRHRPMGPAGRWLVERFLEFSK